MPAINFQARFASAVKMGGKRQTVRPVRRQYPIKPGDRLFLYTGQRTANADLLREATCISVQEITVNSAHDVWLGDNHLSASDIILMAESDGFENNHDFAEFFEKMYGGLPFKGVLIKW